MAPFTSTRSVAFTPGCFSHGNTMQEEQAKEVITKFFDALAICLCNVETYKVRFINVVLQDTKFITL